MTVLRDDSRREGGLLLALDQGTTNTKALLVDLATGAILARGSHRVGIAFPSPGEVEQDAGEIWEATQLAIDECLRAAGNPALAGLSISNQRESVAVWDALTGEPLGPVLGWQDARTAPLCRELADHAPLVRERTGLQLDPMFSAPKLRWLLDRVPAGSALRVGTIDTYLVHRLTGQYVAEAGNASRTLLLDLETCDWDTELLDLFGIPSEVLAPVVRSDAQVGVTGPGLRVPEGVPVLAVLADSHAALYRHAGGRAGEGKVTYGTGSSVMVATASREAPEGIAATLAWLADQPVYAREGNVVASGAALSWMASLLTGGDIGALGELACSATGPEVSFVPAFSGLGAPHFDRAATGIVAGLDGGTGPAELARAAFDAVAQQIADVVEAMEGDGRARLDVLHADGGATVSELLMQAQADLLARELRVPADAEASALGAALLAAAALGDGEAATRWAKGAGPARVVVPQMSERERERHRARWRGALARSRGRAVEASR